MKLTSRLVIVLTIFISIATFSAGLFSVITNHDQQVSNYKKSLNVIHAEMKNSLEDPITGIINSKSKHNSDVSWIHN